MNPARLLVLGGYGRTGRLVSDLLLSWTDARVEVAGRRLERAEALAKELEARHGAGRVSPRRLDAADQPGLLEAFRSADLVVVASSTPQLAGAVANAALEAGCDYLDVQFDRRRLEQLRGLAGRIEDAGRCFITEAGFHPGLPSALVRHAARLLESVEKAEVMSLIRMRISLRDEMPESIDELVRSFIDFQPLVYRGGRWRKPPLGLLWPYRFRRFPPPFGTKACVPLFFAEMERLPELVPGLEETAFYMAGFNWFVDWIVSPALIATLLVLGERAVRPCGRVLFRSLGLSSWPPYGTVLRVEARGTSGGRPASASLDLFHEDEYFFTAAPVVAALRQYLDGTIRKPGLFMMGHAVDTARLFEDMAKMGIRVDARGPAS